MKKFTKIFCFILCGIVICNRSNAAIDVYMKIMNAAGVQIKGDVVAKGFENDIEITSIGQSSSNIVTISGAGSNAGKVSIGDFSFQMAVNSASQVLMSYMALGQHLASVDIYYVKSGTGCTCSFYRIHLEDVFVANVSEASSDENELEQISLVPTQVAWGFYKQDVTGAYPSKPTTQFGWDKAKNIAFNYSF